MPGRLIMDTNGANGAGVARNGKLNAAADEASARPETTITTTTIAQKRSDPPALTNGDHIPGLGPYPTPNGASPTSPPARQASTLLDLPPELIHVTEGFQSLGTLVERVTQECYNRLDLLLDQMAKLEVPTNAALTNGASHHAAANGVGSNTKANQEKKKLMLEFAMLERARFIKMLVLSQWSRNADDVSKMIDLRVWSMENFTAYDDAANRVGHIKFEGQHFKVRNPDMKTALAVLSTGKVPWMPDVRVATACFC
jgi:mediator of RNA polymerase II transcription subunit 14